MTFAALRGNDWPRENTQNPALAGSVFCYPLGARASSLTALTHPLNAAGATRLAPQHTGEVLPASEIF